MKTALVVGGTGPTGPYVVNGLLQRGYEVTILHGGFHEIEFDRTVEHIHSDPHFQETLDAALGDRRWDLFIFTYGRLRLGVEAAKGRTDRFIGVGASNGGLARPGDPRWGFMGQHVNVSEDDAITETSRDASKFGFQIAEAERVVLAAHRQGHYSATYIGFPILYGPRQPGPHDWSIVRRILDGRRQFVIADGGIKVEARAYVENAAHGLLLAVDQPDVAGGKSYVIADQKLYTMRQRIDAIARHLHHDWVLVDMPWDIAQPCHVLWRNQRDHRVRDTHKIQAELGYKDVVPADEAIKKSTDWLIANRPQPGGEEELQLGDPFDYDREDALITNWVTTLATLPTVDYPMPAAAHMYRHPAYPNEPWRRPGNGKPATAR